MPLRLAGRRLTRSAIVPCLSARQPRLSTGSRRHFGDGLLDADGRGCLMRLFSLAGARPRVPHYSRRAAAFSISATLAARMHFDVAMAKPMYIQEEAH